MTLTRTVERSAQNPSRSKAESSSSQLPAHTSSADRNSSSSCELPSGSCAVSSPVPPLTSSYPIGSELPIPKPSIDISHAAIRGSSNADPLHKGLHRDLKAAYLAGAAKEAAQGCEHAQEALEEEEEEGGANVLEEEKPVKGLADGDIIEKQEAREEKRVLNDRVIAVDFDDVCSQYIPKLCAEHNAKYGTDITPEDFKTYIFFQNRGWGTPAETQRKLAQLEKDTALTQIAPVPGFATALRALKILGHQIHIVTARAEPFKPSIIAWLGLNGITVGDGPGDSISAVWCCSSYSKGPIPEMRPTASGVAEEEELNDRLLGMFGKGKSGMSKLKINAALFIDDHHGNLEPIISSDNPIPCLLFGDYPWNRARSGFNTPGEFMTFEQRMQAGLDITVEDIEMGLYLHRVKGWADVVKWVMIWDKQAAEDEEDAE